MDLIVVVLIALAFLAIGFILLRSIWIKISPYLALIIGFFSIVEFRGLEPLDDLANIMLLIIGVVATWELDKKLLLVIIGLLIFAVFLFASLYFIFGYSMAVYISY